MGTYIIKVWETEEEREQGLSYIVENDFDSISYAIERAKKIDKEESYNAIEVQNTKENKTYYSRTPESEDSYTSNIIKAEMQEKINKYAKLVYNSELQNNYEEMYGNAEDIIRQLRKDVKYMNNHKEEYDEEQIEFSNEESKELIKEIEEEFEDEDYIHISEHPMSGYFVLDTDLNDCLDTLLEYYEDIIDDMEFGQANISDVVQYYFDYNDIKNLMSYGTDRDSYNMTSHSKMYEDILELLKIDYRSITTDEISDGKYTTTIEFDDNNAIALDLNAGNGVNEVVSNIESIKEEFITFKKFLKNKEIEKIKNIDLEEIANSYYKYHNLEKRLSPEENIDRKRIVCDMYDEILTNLGFNISYITIDEINDQNYKTTLVVDKEHKDYYFSSSFTDIDMIKNNLNYMRNYYLEVLSEQLVEEEYNMEME